MEMCTLLYDADCGFCRWSVSRILSWDRRGLLRAVPLDDPETGRLLGDMDQERRFASWHLVTPEGLIYSAGGAVPVLLRMLPGGRPAAAIAEALPGLVEWAYSWVARNRHRLTRLTRTEACKVETSRIRKVDAGSQD
ncbi:MAG: thiol-disulfide oxidoreductase DCC family protein [bacterium]